MAAILQISACFMLLLRPCSTATCSTTKQCENDLYLASFNGELEKVTEALESHISPNGHNVKYWTPLMAAAQEGHLSVVQILIDHGANITATRPSTGSTALYIAATSNQAEIVRVLLGACNNVNDRNNGGFTPLMVAAQLGHISVVRELLKCDANLELKESTLEATALYQAVDYNQPSVARKLVVAGANVNVMNKNGVTPLMKAVKCGNYSVVKVLLKAPDMEVDLVEPSQNWTALHYAARYVHIVQPAIAQLLLNKGADRTKQTKDRFTPATIAGKHDNDVVQKIIENYKYK